MSSASRGEVWLVELSATSGHEQSGVRPALVVSVDPYNQGPAQLVVVCPITRTDRGVLLHVRLQAPEGGLRHPSVILCDAVRSISLDRLVERWGAIERETLDHVEDRLRILLGL